MGIETDLILSKLAEITSAIEKLSEKVDTVKDDHNALSKRVDYIEFQCAECRKDREVFEGKKGTTLHKAAEYLSVFLKICAVFGIISGVYYILFEKGLLK